MSLSHLSLFSGIGGIDLAAEWAGFTTIAFCEKDKYCQKILSKHWPNVPIYDDIRKLSGKSFRGVDLVTGGFPCQPFSHAGKREGSSDDRALWPEMLRIIKESEPTWVIGENVAGILSMVEFEHVLTSLEGAGYEVQPLVIPACGVGAPHRRDRVFIVAYSESAKQSKQSSGNHAWQAQQPGTGAGHRGASRCPAKGIDLTHGASTDVPKDVGNSHGIGCEDRTAISVKTETQEPDADSLRGDNGGSGPWSIEPAVDRMVNGFPGRAHRLRGLGNAVVPRQIFPILRTIAQIEISKQ